MPRRKQQRRDEALQDGPGAAEKDDRVAVFERTKMCKFHILGSCTKGEACRFAHDRSQLHALPDLVCTKLCKTLIATGACFNPTCRYAHSKEELRSTPDPAATHTPRGARAEKDPQPKALPSPASMPTSHSQSIQERAFLDTAVMQAAILQMGQAAQAHLAEAAHLQIMAAHLQGGAAATNSAMQAALSDSMPQYALNSGQMAGLPGGLGVPGAPEPRSVLAQHITQGSAGTFGSDEPMVTVKNTFLDVSDPNSSFGPLRMINSAAGRLCSLTEGVDDSPLTSSTAAPAAVAGTGFSPLPPAAYGAGGLSSTRSRPVTSSNDAAMTRALNVDPVQILPESLRSMSSSSQSLVEDAAPAASAASNTSGPKHGRTIRNSPLGREHEMRRKSSSNLGALPEDTLGLAEHGDHWGGLQGSSFGADGADAGVEPEPGIPPTSLHWPSRMAPESMVWTVDQSNLHFMAGADDPSMVPDVNGQHFAELERQDLSVSAGEAVCADGERRRSLNNGAANACVGTGGARRRAEDRAADDDAAAGANGSSTYAPMGDPHMFAHMLMTSGVTVKNTFLDFETDEPVSALRAVQTASGRLDLMGED